MKPIKDAPGYYRDEKTNAVINMNVAELEALRLKQQSKQEVEELRSEIDELKTLLQKVLKDR